MKKNLPILMASLLLHVFFAGAALSQKLRVMTYNVHHCNPPSVAGKIDVEAIAKVIKEAKPDLVALQEIDVFTSRSGKSLHEARELARLTNMYSFFGKAIDFAGGEYGIAILSKYPLLDSALLALPMKEGVGGEPRALIAVTVELKKGQRILFACTHLELKPENRILQVQKIHNVLKDSSVPVILAGDFNDEPGSEAINYMDSFLKRSCVTNCPMTFPNVAANKEIDMIMFSPGRFTIKSHKTINESYASDHLPLVTELKLVR